MNRREYLKCSGLVLGSASLAGCISTRSPDDFQTCDRLVVPIEDLPEPAYNEVQTALSEGLYETDGDFYLDSLINIEESYLGDEDGTNYRAEVDRGEILELQLNETIVSAGNTDLYLVNETEQAKEGEVVVERRSEEVVNTEFSVNGDAREMIAEDFNHLFGSYSAEVKTENIEGEVSWSVDLGQRSMTEIRITEDSIEKQDRPRDMVDCRQIWATDDSFLRSIRRQLR